MHYVDAEAAAAALGLLAEPLRRESGLTQDFPELWTGPGKQQADAEQPRAESNGQPGRDDHRDEGAVDSTRRRSDGPLIARCHFRRWQVDGGPG